MPENQVSDIVTVGDLVEVLGNLDPDMEVTIIIGDIEYDTILKCESNGVGVEITVDEGDSGIDE